MWSIEDVAESLLLERASDAPGASFLIVGGFDPSGVARTSEEMFSVVRDGIADNFWPALAKPSGGVPPVMRATVRQYRNDELVAEQLVDPEARHKDRVSALQRHWANEVDDSLENPGDVVRRPVTLSISSQVDGDAEAMDHEATLLVVFSSEEETQRGRVFAHERSPYGHEDPPGYGRCLSELLGSRVYCLQVRLQAIGPRIELLRGSYEPLNHPHMTIGSRLKRFPRRTSAGARQNLIDFQGAIKTAVREILRPQYDTTSDGPNSLKALLQLTGPTTVTSTPQVRAVSGHVATDGSWVLEEVEVSLPKRDDDQGWLLVPVVRFAVESGAGLPVRALGLGEIEGCSVDDGIVRTSPGASRGEVQSLYRCGHSSCVLLPFSA